MSEAWYQALSMAFGYVSAGVALLVFLFSLRQLLSDSALYGRVKRNLVRVGSAGTFRVLSQTGRRLRAGQELRVPYEGTMGSSRTCDIRIPYRRVHLRSAFFWMEDGALHVVPLHRDGFLADEAPVQPGDEAILSEGAVLKLGDLKLQLHLFSADGEKRAVLTGPYVTSARKSRAQQGRGDGIGAPGKGEAKRAAKRTRKSAEE